MSIDRKSSRTKKQMTLAHTFPDPFPLDIYWSEIIMRVSITHQSYVSFVVDTLENTCIAFDLDRLDVIQLSLLSDPGATQLLAVWGSAPAPFILRLHESAAAIPSYALDVILHLKLHCVLTPVANTCVNGVSLTHVAHVIRRSTLLIVTECASFSSPRRLELCKRWLRASYDGQVSLKYFGYMPIT